MARIRNGWSVIRRERKAELRPGFRFAVPISPLSGALLPALQTPLALRKIGLTLDFIWFF